MTITEYKKILWDEKLNVYVVKDKDSLHHIIDYKDVRYTLCGKAIEANIYWRLNNEETLTNCEQCKKFLANDILHETEFKEEKDE